MTVYTAIDRTAPVVVDHSILIGAPIEKVWALHADINRWPAWQHDITAAECTGPLAPGAEFTWTSFNFTVTSTVYSLDSGSSILWGGESGGITGVHEWIFEPTPAGTRVSTSESFAGEPVDHAVDELQAQLDFSLRSWLTNLKTEAEKK